MCPRQQTTFSSLEAVLGNLPVLLRTQRCGCTVCTDVSLPIFLHRTLCIQVLVPNQLPVLQPDHQSAKAQNSSRRITLCPFQCFRTSLYRPGLDHANSGADKMFVGPCRSAQPDTEVHGEPSLPSWAPDSFARTASAKLSKGLWNLDMVNSSNGVLPLDRTTNLFLR